MAKYSKFGQRSLSRKERSRLHPVWNGIGCLLMILIPVISYAGAVMLVERNLEERWLPVSRELYQTISLPVLGEVPHLFANLLVTGALALFLFSVLTVLFALISQASGVSTEGPYDAPPVRSRPKAGRR
jgi:hypothetical protein